MMYLHVILDMDFKQIVSSQEWNEYLNEDYETKVSNIINKKLITFCTKLSRDIFRGVRNLEFTFLSFKFKDVSNLYWLSVYCRGVLCRS